jgi:hypothetical protein
MRTTIDQDREVGRGNTGRYPVSPFNTEAKTPQEIKEELSVDVIVGFLQVQLTHKPWNTRFQPSIQTLICY